MLDSTDVIMYPKNLADSIHAACLKKKDTLVVPGGNLDTEGLEEDVQTLFRQCEDGAVEVHEWVTGVSNDAFAGTARNICRNGRRTFVAKCGTKVLEDGSAKCLHPRRSCGRARIS